MYKAEKKVLPTNIQRLFQERDSHYDLRGISMFEQPAARINAKYHCISVKGVILWNKCKDEWKLSATWNKFKRLYKMDVINRYRTE